MLDPTTGHHDDAKGTWAYRTANLDVLVSGTAFGPDADAFRVACGLLSRLDPLHAVAARYLDTFVIPTSEGSAWEPESLRVDAAPPFDPDNPIDIDSDGPRVTLGYHRPSDIYGLWMVGFIATDLPVPDAWMPHRFAREQV